MSCSGTEVAPGCERVICSPSKESSSSRWDSLMPMASSQVVGSVTLQVRDPFAAVPPAALIFTFAVRFSTAHHLKNIIRYSVRINKENTLLPFLVAEEFFNGDIPPAGC